MGGSAISKRMQLLVEWADKGFQAGIEKDKRGLDEIKKRALSVAKAMLAATAAIVGLTAGLLKLIKQGSEVKSVQESFEGFVRAAEMSPDTLDKVRASVRGTISDMELMQASVRGLSAGLDPGRIVEFWQKSKQIADVSSQDTLMVFESLVMGMTKLEVETLKTIGITIRAEDVYKDYAASIGKTQAQLTTYDKQIAFSIALEEKYRKNFQGVGDVTTRVREKFQQLTAGVKNLYNRFVVMVAESPKVMGFLSFLSGEVKNIDDRLESMRPGLDRVIATMILMSRKSVDVAKGIKNWKDELLALGSIGVMGYLIMQLAKFKVAITGAFGAGAMSITGIVGIIAYLILAYRRTLQAFLTIFESMSRAFYYTIGGIIESIQLLVKAINKIPGIDLSGMIETFEPTLAWFRKQAFGETIFDKWKANIEKWPSLFDLIGKKLFGKKDEFRDQAESVKRELSFIEDLEIRRKATPQFELAISDPLWALKETGKEWKKEAERTVDGFWSDFENAYEEGRKKAALEIAKQNELLAKQQFFTTPKLEIPKPILPKIPAIEIPRPVGMDQAERDIEYYKEMIMSLKDTGETVPYLREKYSIPEPVTKAPKRDREQLAMLDEDEQAFLDSWDRRVEYAQSSSDILLSIEEGRYLSNADLWEMERVDFLRNMQMREQSYQAGYQVMGQYSDRFFNRNAKLMRVTTAMLIRGATEAVAAWIEAKTEEWRLNAAEAAIQALSFAAHGHLGAAAIMGGVALKWGALAGGAALAAGGARYAGQQKAEGMMAEQETQWEEATAGGEGEEMGRQKREASGVVNARPIHINVYSTANFNSGYMIFGDSETAANELYEERFRSRIESDIESGEIQV